MLAKPNKATKVIVKIEIFFSYNYVQNFIYLHNIRLIYHYDISNKKEYYMSVTWEKWVDAWRQGTDKNDSTYIEALITDDFNWNTSDFNRQTTIDWVNSTEFRVVGDVTTLYENDEVIVGIHEVNSGKSYDTVMGIAYLRDGKVFKYSHQRKTT